MSRDFVSNGNSYGVRLHVDYDSFRPATEILFIIYYLLSIIIDYPLYL